MEGDVTKIFKKEKEDKRERIFFPMSHKISLAYIVNIVRRMMVAVRTTLGIASKIYSHDLYWKESLESVVTTTSPSSFFEKNEGALL